MIKIQKVTDEAFRPYGRVLTGEYNVAELIQEMEKTPVLDEVVYVPSVEAFEQLAIGREFNEGLYGGLPVQIGYCNGHNQYLNALEYHRNSEFNIAVTDLILILGKQQDMNGDFTYETSKAEAFLVPKGTVIECYATTLHYAPCGVGGKGFRCVVVLPKGTNLDLKKKLNTTKEDKLLTAQNKWLLAHREAQIKGAFEGLTGENIKAE